MAPQPPSEESESVRHTTPAPPEVSNGSPARPRLQSVSHSSYGRAGEIQRWRTAVLDGSHTAAGPGCKEELGTWQVEIEELSHLASLQCAASMTVSQACSS